MHLRTVFIVFEILNLNHIAHAHNELLTSEHELRELEMTQSQMFFPPEGVQEHVKDSVNVDFLLPTGILVPLPCKPSQKLEDIKECLWRKAKEFPLFGLLRYVHNNT